MDTFRCSACGGEHSLSDIEPCFDRPDAYFDVPAHERGERTWNDPHLCVIWETEQSERRHFLRVLLPIPIHGEDRAYNWGVWAEVAEEDFARTHDGWSDPHRAQTPPFAGQLANLLPQMPPTLGLLGAVQVSAPGEIPRFGLAPHADHPLAQQQRDGVFPEQVIEWASRAVHL
jgi:hypothetical protein